MTIKRTFSLVSEVDIGQGDVLVTEPSVTSFVGGH